MVFYDLPIDSRADTDGWRIRADSSLALDGTVRLEVVGSDGRMGTLAIRRPGWTTQWRHRWTVGGAVEVQDEYLRLNRAWNTGESVQVRYRMETRLVHHPERPSQVALFHGPWLLEWTSGCLPNFSVSLLPRTGWSCPPLVRTERYSWTSLPLKKTRPSLLPRRWRASI